MRDKRFVDELSIKELGKIGGVVVIIFGLANLDILRIPWLYYGTRPQWNPKWRIGFRSLDLMVVFFATVWTSCINITLGAILTLGFSQQTSGQAMWLSSGYVLGLGIPFLVIRLAFERAAQFVHRFEGYIHPVQIASGLLLIVIGLMLLTNQMSWFAIRAQRNGLYFDLPLGGASAPTYLVTVFAGLISFLSPCVLPQVPAYVGLSKWSGNERYARRSCMTDQVIVDAPVVSHRKPKIRKILSWTLWCFDHWLRVVSLFLGVFISLPFLAPLFMHPGWWTPASVIYAIYRMQCHQMAQRSFFLFGPQPMYNIAQLPISLTGRTESGTLLLRGFIGNPIMAGKSPGRIEWFICTRVCG